MKRGSKFFNSGLFAVCVLTACIGGNRSSTRLQEPVELTFESPQNLVVVQARIGDQGPFRFLLDSGATGTVIDANLARRIGLKTTKAYTRGSTAAGSRVTAASVPGGIRFSFTSDFHIQVDRVITAPFTDSGLTIVGEHFDGILGSAIFHQYVVAVDYNRGTLQFHDPPSYRYQGKGTELALYFPTFMPKLPFIKATLVNGDNRLEDFLILVDSGGATMGTASVAKRSDWDALITPENVTVDVMGATGLSNDPEGTTHDAFVTRMDRLFLGPFEIPDPLVSYSSGGPSIPIMGASLLYRFSTIYDYSRKRLILEPNHHLGEPQIMDYSGTMLVNSDASGNSFEVMFVADKTPAKKVGLARGDTIQAVNGIPVAKLKLGDVRAMFGRPCNVLLEVSREGQTRLVILKIRDLFDH